MVQPFLLSYKYTRCQVVMWGGWFHSESFMLKFPSTMIDWNYTAKFVLNSDSTSTCVNKYSIQKFIVIWVFTITVRVHNYIIANTDVNGPHCLDRAFLIYNRIYQLFSNQLWVFYRLQKHWRVADCWCFSCLPLDGVVAMNESYIWPIPNLPCSYPSLCGP